MTKKIDSFGFVRVSAVSPRVRVADCGYNAARIVECMAEAERDGVSVLVFPELSVTAYTCKDAFHQATLRNAALEALGYITREGGRHYSGLAIVGLPLVVDDMLFNCAAILFQGKVLGVVPKSFIPNYKEFEENRWFSPAAAARSQQVEIKGKIVPFGTDLLFRSTDTKELTVGVEICEDGWLPIPPSSFQALNGATVLCNLSASNELVGKAGYRRQLMGNQSGRCMAAEIYASCGYGESTQDVVFGGHCIVAENGWVLAESERFKRGGTRLIADIDVERLKTDRLRTTSFGEAQRDVCHTQEFRVIPFTVGRRLAPPKLSRTIDAHPFVPQGKELADRCQELLNIGVFGLATRLEHLWTVKCLSCQSIDSHDLRSLSGMPTQCSCSLRQDRHVVIGVSGGLDSTLALVETCMVMDMLGVPRKNIHAYTMPGFGTTKQTKGNAWKLMDLLGVTASEVPISALCLAEMKAIGHKPFGIELNGMSLRTLNKKLKELPAGSQDLDFENVQARMRTKVLFDRGFVIGTGDLSEILQGWCTYNGDHMSSYNPNTSVPKTLVKFVLAWAAYNLFDGEVRQTILDIVGTEISPELLPTGKDGKITQKTESVIGPYELHDFFAYYFLRFGFSPEKILYLAAQATFDQIYSAEERRQWLQSFIRRFFASQFKRSCSPDGPKGGSISASPRGDLRWATDAHATGWLRAFLGKQEVDLYPGQVKYKEEEHPMNTTADTTGPIVRRALGLIDPANDFGSPAHSDGQGNTAQLPVPGGEEVGPVIGRLQESGCYAVIFAGMDTHEPGMFNFASVNPEKTPYLDTVLDRDGEPATVYPDHCLKGSWGADFLPGVRKEKIDVVFPKGDSPDKDSYSAAGNPNLIPYLRQQGISHIDLTGLVFRICVGITACDLAKAGFKVRVITDATRDLDIPAFAHVIEDMKDLGIEFTTSDQVAGQAA